MSKSKVSIAKLREMHDNELSKLDTREAKKVLDNRTKAANFIRLTVARMYGLNDRMTFHQWATMPCITDKDNFGVIDIARGVAFDSTIPCIPECEDLGYTAEVYAAANGHEGTVVFDGEVVQHDGTAVEDGKVLIPTMPPGWRQIALPTWRGYEGDGKHLVPKELYENNRLKPELVAFGLRTCYGTAGAPRRTLMDWLVHHNGDVPVPNWINKDFERVDPSWWPLNEDQKTRIRKMIQGWMMDVCMKLAAHLPNAEAVTTALSQGLHSDKIYSITGIYPDQIERNGLAADSEESDLIWKRAEAARSVVNDVTDEFDVSRVYHALTNEHDRYNSGLLTTARGILMRAVYNKLIPVAESLRWMWDVDQKRFEICLSQTAKEIASVFCSSFDDSARKLIEQEMVTVVYENGPVYMSA